MNRDSALQQAIESGDARSVSQLLAQGADPNGRTKYTTLLHTAIVLQQTAIVRLLLKGGADAQCPDTEGLYPLHIAASKGSTGIANALVQAGALLEQTTPEGSTALDLAAASNYAATARALVQAGADLEHANADGNTPLLTASALGNRGAVQTLLQLGADATATNRKGQTALHLALWSLYSNALPKWSHTERKTHYYIRQGALHMVEPYNAHRPETGRLLSLRDQRAVALAVWGPTEHLSYLEALQTVQLLIKHGQCLTQRDDNGATPLHLACFAGAGLVIQNPASSRGAPASGRLGGQARVAPRGIEPAARWAARLFALLWGGAHQCARCARVDTRALPRRCRWACRDGPAPRSAWGGPQLGHYGAQ